MTFYGWKHLRLHVRAHDDAQRGVENKVPCDEVLGAMVLAETTKLGFDAFAKVVRQNGAP